MDQLIPLLIWIMFFAIVGYGMWLVCVKFFPEAPPARWICGGFLLIAILYWVSRVVSSGIPVLLGK